MYTNCVHTFEEGQRINHLSGLVTVKDSNKTTYSPSDIFHPKFFSSSSSNVKLLKICFLRL
ncbi:uncharacterized protein DS421_14g467310 [Arachis hypogaea]|nr:uncharacterized protein DS421_14g467310 [Arachis hypogaea]